MSDLANANAAALIEENKRLKAECEQVDQDRIKTCELLEQARDDLAALRKSHAEAVEAAVREIEAHIQHLLSCRTGDALNDTFYNGSVSWSEQAIRTIRKHLGPAQAGGE